VATVDGEWVTDWPWLAAQRGRWLKREKGTATLSPARLASRAQSNLAAFAEFVAREPGAHTPSRPAVAMAFLGPPGVPPPEVWDAYVAVHQELGATIPEAGALNPFDLVLALGCGWRRAVTNSGTSGQWGGWWKVAYAAMINQLAASVLATNRLLVAQFPQFALTDDDLLELPGDFTVSFLGACDCGHHRRECGHTCGRTCCFPRHDLGHWDPSTCDLRPFVDQAVRGTAAKRILGAAFAESLTYAALKREGRILLGPGGGQAVPRLPGAVG
jgi:hypothetical protein